MISIQTEALSAELFDELLPLARQCWAENTALKGETCAFYGERNFVVEPDLETYQRLSAAGSLVIVTLRDEGTLKGYAEGYVYRSPHHRNILAGNGDSIYLSPEYRAYTPVVIEKFIQEMRNLKAAIIGWPAHPDSPVYKVLKAMGFVGDDVIMEKKLCA